MLQRWALRLTIAGDLRFASHLDCVRAVERTAARAGAPLRFTQGFNPHPILSLPCPRPVGVTTCDDLAVLTLDEPTGGEELARRMTARAPRGMAFGRPVLLASRRTPRPKRIHYELALDAGGDVGSLGPRLARLETRASWPIERVKPPARRGRRPRRRTVDLRSLIETIAITDGGLLQWTARPQENTWARVDEVLRLVGLDRPDNRARVIRIHVNYDWPRPEAAATKREEPDVQGNADK